MIAPPHLPARVAVIWLELVAQHDDEGESIQGPEFDAYCGTVANLRDAQERIAEEGMIVPDAKSMPMPHPALAIEKSCIGELKRWGSRFRPVTKVEAAF